MSCGVISFSEISVAGLDLFREERQEKKPVDRINNIISADFLIKTFR